MCFLLSLFVYILNLKSHESFFSIFFKDTKSIEWAIQNGEPGILEILTKTEDFDCGILHKYLVPGKKV